MGRILFSICLQLSAKIENHLWTIQHYCWLEGDDDILHCINNMRNWTLPCYYDQQKNDLCFTNLTAPLSDDDYGLFCHKIKRKKNSKNGMDCSRTNKITEVWRKRHREMVNRYFIFMGYHEFVISLKTSLFGFIMWILVYHDFICWKISLFLAIVDNQLVSTINMSFLWIIYGV